jgi:hypothetical protein
VVTSGEVLVTARHLMAKIMDTEAKEPGTQSIEDLLEVLLQLMRRHPDRRSEFVSELSNLIVHPAPGELILAQPGITEILECCMHDLRWPEIRSVLASIDVDGQDLRSRRWAERVLEAFDDDWDVADTYRKYR